MTVVLFDTPKSQLQLYPLSLVYPVSHIRHGCFTGIEWYERISGIKVKTLSDAYKKPVEITEDDAPFLCIDASLVPSIAFWQECLRLNPHEMLEDHSGILAYMIEKPPIFGTFPLFLQSVPTNVQVKRINHPMDWVKSNAEKILLDISLLANDTPLLTNDHINRIFGEHPVFMESGAKAMGCTFNTIEGPVFIGKDALLMEGGLIRGPVSIGRYHRKKCHGRR
ncbi:MAG: hypothetical protein MUE71_08830 [Chitinophagaceae bacterium]|nr:hypothetical protein [Chitinophagaceae bacterium]